MWREFCSKLPCRRDCSRRYLLKKKLSWESIPAIVRFLGAFYAVPCEWNGLNPRFPGAARYVHGEQVVHHGRMNRGERASTIAIDCGIEPKTAAGTALRSVACSSGLFVMITDLRS